MDLFLYHYLLAMDDAFFILREVRRTSVSKAQVPGDIDMERIK